MPETEETMRWIEIKNTDVEGRGWNDTALPFDRLPAKAKDSVPNVYPHCCTSTGMSFFFHTDSTKILVRTGLKLWIGEDNFNATAHSGTDLYVFDPDQNRWRWAAATPHFVLKGEKPDYCLLKDLPKKMRHFRMYLPFRNQLTSLEVGVDKKAKFTLVPPRKTPPLVYYGTSIIHGAFSIRSGLGVAQILGRKLDMPLINLGFSGAARMEKEMADLLAELHAGIYIIDPYHNVTTEIVRSNTERFIDTLCSACPDTPVFMLGAPQLINGWLHEDVQKEQDTRTALYGKICRRMMKKYPNLYYLKGTDFYGSDEVSMDGVHPNDEAFAHMAKILEREIRKRVTIC